MTHCSTPGPRCILCADFYLAPTLHIARVHVLASCMVQGVPVVITLAPNTAPGSSASCNTNSSCSVLSGVIDCGDECLFYAF